MYINRIQYVRGKNENNFKHNEYLRFNNNTKSIKHTYTYNKH